MEAIGDVDRIFSDKVSGGSRESRAELAECIKYVREGDVVRVASMDRLARSLRDLREIVDEIIAKGASVQFIKESQTYSPATHDPLSQLMLHMLGAFAEFERALIRERQAEGIRIAKAEGKYRGRAKKLSEEQRSELEKLLATGIPKSEVARRFGVNRATIYRELRSRVEDRSADPGGP